MQSAIVQFGTDTLRLFIWLVILSAIFIPLERFFAIAHNDRPRSPVKGEIGYYFLNNLLPPLLIAMPLAALAAGARALLPEAWLALIRGLPFAATLGIALILSEIGGYWGHRLSHEWPILWQFHARHHQPAHVNWLTNTHAHPVDMIWSRLTALFPVYALGFANPTLGEQGMIPVIITLFNAIGSFFIHANVRWRFGPVEALIVTPAFHHWHHANDEWRDHNYATILPVMDRIFGTHHLPDHFPPCYGIDDEKDMAPLLPFSGERRG